MRTNDGQVLTGKTPEEIVRQLHKMSFTPADNLRAFMRETAERVMLQYGKRVRSVNAARFVEDLLKIGLLVADELDDQRSDPSDLVLKE